MIRLVLLGDPVVHSLSPVIHSAGLVAVGIAGIYTARRVDAEGFLSACEDLRSGRLDGANVTMPHKRLAADRVDQVSAEAERSGSVNTIVAREGVLTGHNTDVAGVRAVWVEHGLPADAPVLILGAGGAAAAAVVALEDRDLVVSARRPSAAEALLGGLPGGTVGWGSGVEGAVVVNATPLGMLAEPLPSAVLSGAAGLLDMAYGSSVTPAVRAARAAGLPTAEGADLLLAQAFASFELWTGVPAPREAMRAALQMAQERR